MRCTRFKNKHAHMPLEGLCRHLDKVFVCICLEMCSCFDASLCFSRFGLMFGKVSYMFGCLDVRFLGKLCWIASGGFCNAVLIFQFRFSLTFGFTSHQPKDTQPTDTLAWNPTASYSILHYLLESCVIQWNPYGMLWKPLESYSTLYYTS